MTLGLIRAAERAGFKAIALTVDTPFFGTREADVRNGFALPAHLSLANFELPSHSTDIITEKADGSGLAKCEQRMSHALCCSWAHEIGPVLGSPYVRWTGADLFALSCVLIPFASPLPAFRAVQTPLPCSTRVCRGRTSLGCARRLGCPSCSRAC